MATTPSADRPVLSVLANDSEMNGIIRAVDVEDHDRLIDRARITVQDAANVCTNFADRGQKVTITMGWGNARSPVFEGYITDVRPVDNSPTRPRTVIITALDPSYFMHLRRRVPRGFPSGDRPGKLSEIIRWIVTRPEYSQRFHIDENNLNRHIVLDRDVEFSASNPLIQNNETDLQFLYRLANLYGARTFVEYNSQPSQKNAVSQFYFISERRLMQDDPIATLHYCQGVSEVLEFSIRRDSSDAAPKRSAIAVDPTTGIALEAIPPAQSDEGKPPPDISAQVAAIARQQRDAAAVRDRAEAARSAPVQPRDLTQYYADTGLPSNPNLVQAITRQDPTRILGLQGTGVVAGNASLRAKSKIHIIGFSVWDEGDWYVHKINHRMTIGEQATDQSFRTHFEVSR